MKKNKQRCKDCGHIKEKHSNNTIPSQPVCNVKNCKCRRFVSYEKEKKGSEKLDEELKEYSEKLRNRDKILENPKDYK